MAKFDLAKFAPKKAAVYSLPKSILVYGPPKTGKTAVSYTHLTLPTID